MQIITLSTQLALQISALLLVSRWEIPAFALNAVPVATTRNVRIVVNDDGCRRSFHAFNSALFMAKNPKKKDKKKNVSATKKGFGAPPPSLEEIVAGFPTRLPRDPEAVECPCGDEQSRNYASCCQPFHLGKAYPGNPHELLKSRYVAFSYRLPLHVMDTTHPTSRDYLTDRVAWAKSLNKEGMFDSYEFVGLEDVGDVEYDSDDGNENEAFVNFKVRMRDMRESDSGEERGEVVIAERSRFLRDGEPSKWTYASGEVRTEAPGIDDVVLNP